MEARGGLSISTLTAASGVLHFDERERQSTMVTVTAPAAEPRHVLLEVPKAADQTIAPGFARPSKETATAWRFSLLLKPGEVRTETIALDRARRQAISLLNDSATIARLLNEQGLSEAARAAFAKIADLRAVEAGKAADRDLLKTQLDSVTRDEARLRDNLKAVADGDALHGRLTRQLDADETKIGQLSDAIDAAEQVVARAHQALVDGINGLKI
jgi:hypothetical protein